MFKRIHLRMAVVIPWLCAFLGVIGPFSMSAQSQTQTKLDSVAIHPAKGIDPESVEIHGDTLYVGDADDSLAFPFGMSDDFQQIADKHPNLTAKKRVLGHGNERMVTCQLSFDLSFVKFGATDEENGSIWLIYYGKIVNSEVIPWGGVKIGMSEKDFLLKFLQEVTSKTLSRFRVVEIDTGPNGAYTFFVFEDQRLEAIYFNAGALEKGDDVEY